jgi:hypothetical protein
MKRIGYDADNGRYYFRDSDGGIWQSAEGSQYGELTKGPCDITHWNSSELTNPLFSVVSELPSSIAGPTAQEDDDLEAAPTHSNGYQLLNTDPNVRESLGLLVQALTQPLVYHGAQTPH